MNKPLTAAVALMLSMGSICGAIEPTTRPAQAAVPATQPAAEGVVAQPVFRANVVVNAAGVANNFGDAQRRMIEQQRTYLNGLKPFATLKQDELIHFDLIDGRLCAQTSLDTSGRSQRRVAVSDAGGDWLVSLQDIRRATGSSVMVVINRYDFEKVKAGEYWQTSFNLNDQYLMLQEQGVEGSAWFHQMAGMARLNVTSVQNNRGRPVLSLRAANLQQLYAEHPEEVRRYVIPMLVRIGGRNILRPGAADVYAVFEEIPADPAVTRRVTALLPRLDAELFDDRDGASKELARLGSPGVLAAMRLDTAKLSREQKGRLDAFIASEHRRTVDAPLTLRKDVSFLLDALEDDDEAVRLAAKTCLDLAVGHPVPFDVSLPREQRGQAIDALRQSVEPQPAAKPSVPAGEANTPAPALVR